MLARLINGYINPGGVTASNAEDALNFALKDPLRNALVISNLTQLNKDCSLAIKSSSDNKSAIAGFYMDLPYNNIALMAESEVDIKELIGELVTRHVGLEDQPIYGLYDTKITGLIENCFKVVQKTPEIKMTIADTNIPDIDFDTDLYRLERLTTADIVQISHLYTLVPSMAWTPKVLTFGPYYGVYFKEHLVSIAGVHFVTKWTAEIGNIVTHFRHRRQNLAYQCTRAVVNDLRYSCENIFLCVMSDNQPAISLYEKMGFVKVEDLFLVKYYI